MSEQDETARQELLDQQKFLQLERLFIGKFLDLAEHLGCKPEDLNVDLVALVEALQAAKPGLADLVNQSMDGIVPSDIGKRDQEVFDQVIQALAQFADRADKE